MQGIVLCVCVCSFNSDVNVVVDHAEASLASESKVTALVLCS